MLKRSAAVGFAIVALMATVYPVFARGISTLRANNPNAQINVRSQPTINSSSPHYGVSR